MVSSENAWLNVLENRSILYQISPKREKKKTIKMMNRLSFFLPEYIITTQVVYVHCLLFVSLEICI